MFYTNMCCIDSLSDWYCDHSLFYLTLPVTGPPAVSLLVDGEVKDLATHGTSGFPSTSTITQFSECLLPPANEVWGNVIFLHLSVILFTGGGAVCGRGGHAWHGGVCGRGEGGMDGRGHAWQILRYTVNEHASYWNAFLLEFYLYLHWIPLLNVFGYNDHPAITSIFFS